MRKARGARCVPPVMDRPSLQTGGADDRAAPEAHPPYSAAPAHAGTTRGRPGPAPPPASTDAVAARRLRVPDLTPTPRGPEGEVRNTTALLHSKRGGSRYLSVPGIALARRLRPGACPAARVVL
jgi:hypothetical protein